jgi:hypothetical protein
MPFKVYASVQTSSSLDEVAEPLITPVELVLKIPRHSATNQRYSHGCMMCTFLLQLCHFHDLCILIFPILRHDSGFFISIRWFFFLHVPPRFDSAFELDQDKDATIGWPELKSLRQCSKRTSPWLKLLFCCNTLILFVCMCPRPWLCFGAATR